jgi:hypothetical protein
VEVVKGGLGRTEEITQEDLDNVLVLLNQEAPASDGTEAAGSIIRRLKAGVEAEGGPREIEFRESLVNGVKFTTLYIDNQPRVRWADGEIRELRELLGDGMS